jgi:hypothetical protein
MHTHTHTHKKTTISMLQTEIEANKHGFFLKRFFKDFKPTTLLT